MKNNRIQRLVALAAVCFLICVSEFDLVLAESNPQSSVICMVYFTFIGCPNCAVTDPIVLREWTEKYPNLVIIEYGWVSGDWQHPNSQFFGEFAQAYRTQAAVPQLVLSKNRIRLGRLDVPKAEEDIKALASNPCPLIDKSVFWENLNLNELKAEPKIWANGRVLIKLNEKEWLFQWNGEDPPKTVGKEKFNQKELKELLFTQDIPGKLKYKVFDIVEPQKVMFSGSAFPPETGFIPYAEFEHAVKITLSEESVATEEGGQEEEIAPGFEEETVELPFIGKIETKEYSLPLLTVLLAIADGFNPCAFFVLTFLLAALIGLAGARRKILLVGSIFIFFSGLFYFLFMSVLLNVFQLGKHITILTLVAGTIAVFAGVVNIKDYFFFQKGISLTLPKSRKEKFFTLVKNLSLAKSTWALITGTAVIAATVNIYELLCTFGFPMIYTRILTLRELPPLEYYLYLVLYNLIYVLPLAIIVLIFAITLGKKTFSQTWVRRLKLISGFMILLLGFVLIAKPKLLENVLTAFGIVFVAIIISGIVMAFDHLCRRYRRSKRRVLLT